MTQLHLEIDLRGLGSVIKGEGLKVPQYQRSYAWRDEHVEELLDDIAAAVEGDEPEYFLGSVVLAGDTSGGFEVVDGQQRLATTIIFAAAIRDYLLSINENKRADTVAADYLAQTDRRTLELEPRLRLNEIDHPFFHEYVLRPPDDRSDEPKPTRDSHKRILRAYRLANDRVAAIAKSAGQKAALKLLDWTDFIDDRLKVIAVKVPDDANAFTIFETLNDRGLSLAISDLLKNFLFSRGGDRVGEIQASWLAMQSALESVAEDNVIVTFIRHLWSYQYGLTREKDLYRDIKRRIRDKSAAVSFAKLLERQAHIYAGLLNPNSSVWREHAPSVKNRIAALNMMRVEQVRPLLLGVLAKFSKSQTIKAMRLIVSGVVRVVIVGVRGGTYEKLYAALAKQIHDGKITDEAGLRKEMANVVPNDTQFKSEFANARVSKGYLARFYLREIEQYAHPTGTEWIPSDSEDDVSLEHILPKHFDPNKWPAFDAENHKAYLYRMGNQALLAAGDNSLNADDEYKKKRSSLLKSSFETTKKAGSSDKWSPDVIEARQQQLAELAIKVWPLSGEIRKRKAVKKRALKA